MSEKIRARLMELQDLKYREFNQNLVPGMEPDYIIGVRTPQLRALAKEIGKTEEKEILYKELPHACFEENQLHSFLISEEKDFETCIKNLEEFLPYMNNWATCDQCSPKVFRKHKAELVPYIEKWMQSDHTYTIRFAIGMLMQHFLDEDFDRKYPEMVASIRSEEYYVNMEIAWYFATALAKQYEEILPFLLENRMDVWTHNKTIQKAVESFRISPEQKTYLKTLKRKKHTRKNDEY